MFELFYNYSTGHRVPERRGLPQPAFKLAFADYVEVTLTIYSSDTTPMDLSGVASWRGAIKEDVEKDSYDIEPLLRLFDIDFDTTDAENGVLSFPIDCNTTNFRNRILSAANGNLTIYGHDSEDRQIIRIQIEAKLSEATDPPGDPEPDDVPPSSVRTLNGLSGNVVIKTAAGEALPAADGEITLPEIESGASVNGLTGAVVLVDSSGNPLATDGQNIVIPGADCTGDVTAAGDNTFTGSNEFSGGLTVGGAKIVAVHPIWYVSPTGTGAAPGTVAAPAALSAALAYAATGAPAVINLAAGDYTMPSALTGADVAFVGTGSTSFRANGTFFTNSRVRFFGLSIVFVTAFSTCEVSIYSCTGTGVTIRGGRAIISATAFAGTVSVLGGAVVSVYGGSLATLTVSDASRVYATASATITNASPAVNVEGNNRSMIVYGGA